jgi:hypothetical protein
MQVKHNTDALTLTEKRRWVVHQQLLVHHLKNYTDRLVLAFHSIPTFSEVERCRA